MSKQHITKLFEAILQDKPIKAEAMLRAACESVFKRLVKEDHEKSMSEAELKHYIKDLYSKARDEHKEAFAKHLEADECNDEAFDQAAKKHVTSKDKADGLIHKLEKLVGSKIDPKEYKADKAKGETDSKAEKESKMKPGQVKESIHDEKHHTNFEDWEKHAKAKGATDIRHTSSHSTKAYNKFGDRIGTYHHKLGDGDSEGGVTHSGRMEESTRVKEAEQIKQDVLNELKASTLGNYIRKASTDLSHNSFKKGAALAFDSLLGKSKKEVIDSLEKKIDKRHRGVIKAGNKLVKKAKE